MIALLYDVHGNLPALDAVIEDARSVGADRFLLGGDYAFAGAWPLETVERLRTLDADWIRGNGERWTATPSSAPAELGPLLERCAEILGPAVVEELAGLPETLSRDDVLFCHGSPVSDVRSFMPTAGPDDEELLGGRNPGRVVFGHTHLAFRRSGPGGVQLLNPGSVGMPCDGDHRAAYALLHGHGRAEHRRVEYDHQASANAVRELYGDDGEVPARRIEQARLDVS
jgi:diadenosine tetraphosphatase ApaH/serine/threonine PP2A family protein phosphatase